jgi:hypothetical protein
MPTLSASDYTQYLKFKAAAGSAIRPAIQTRDNVSLSQSLINAQILASQAALVTTPATTTTVTLTPTVTDASTTTVVTARSTIFSSIVGSAGGVVVFTTAVEHGLANGALISIQNVPLGTIPVSVNGPVTALVTGVTTFTANISGAISGSTSGGNIANRVYYTTSMAHGLLTGDTVSVTGVGAFAITGASVVAVGSPAQPTTFVLASPAVSSTLLGQTGSITGLVYYTTSAAHGLSAGVRTSVVSISGLTGTPAYNLPLKLVFRVPSTTVFVVQDSATGTAVSGGSGVLTQTTYANPNMALTTNARVVALPVPQVRSTPAAKSTVSFAGTSGALGSSRVQRPGGLPAGFKNSQGTYTRLPQSAGW